MLRVTNQSATMQHLWVAEKATTKAENGEEFVSVVLLDDLSD